MITPRHPNAPGGTPSHEFPADHWVNQPVSMPHVKDPSWTHPGPFTEPDPELPLENKDGPLPTQYESRYEHFAAYVPPEHRKAYFQESIGHSGASARFPVTSTKYVSRIIPTDDHSIHGGYVHDGTLLMHPGTPDPGGTMAHEISHSHDPDLPGTSYYRDAEERGRQEGNADGIQSRFGYDWDSDQSEHVDWLQQSPMASRRYHEARAHAEATGEPDRRQRSWVEGANQTTIWDAMPGFDDAVNEYDEHHGDDKARSRIRDYMSAQFGFPRDHEPLSSPMWIPPLR